MDTYGRIVEAQIPTRYSYAINSTGPAEQYPARDRPTNRRPRRVVHQPHTSRRLLNPMTLDLLGKADSRDWADRLRERLTWPSARVRVRSRKGGVC